MGTGVRYDVAKLQEDMAEFGWIATDLAKRAGVSNMRVSRFLNGTTQTARTAKILASALRQPVSRYVIRRDEGAAA